MAGLTPEQIAALMGKAHGKGDYIARLKVFLDSNEQGVNVKETWPDWEAKKPEAIKQGFENAKNSKNAPPAAEFVKVIKSEDQVYLINMQAAGLATPADNAGTDETVAA